MQGGAVELSVAAVFGSSSGVPAEVLVTFDTFRKGALAPLDSMVFVGKAPGPTPTRCAPRSRRSRRTCRP